MPDSLTVFCTENTIFSVKILRRSDCFINWIADLIESNFYLNFLIHCSAFRLWGSWLLRSSHLRASLLRASLLRGSLLRTFLDDSSFETLEKVLPNGIRVKASRREAAKTKICETAVSRRKSLQKPLKANGSHTPVSFSFLCALGIVCLAL